ncbi:hypothetical protein P8452_64045 [Trifolium repens]|nr:hypothetical protein P8452_64045 [Trifolium repens]
MDPTNGVTLGVTIDSAAVDEQLEVWAASRANFGLNCDQNMDPKKARRVMLKRLESKRYRLKKKMFIANLESKVKETQVQIAYGLQPQIESQLDQKSSLLLEQEMLIHRIKVLENELLYKSALTKELSAELNAWNELYTTQQEQQGCMLNWSDDNMHPFTYNPFSHAYSNYDQGENSIPFS